MLDEWSKEKQALVAEMEDVRESSNQTRLQCNQSLEFYQSHISRLEARHAEEFETMRREVVEAVLGEASIAAENALLLDNIQVLSMKLFAASKMIADKEGVRAKNIENESLQNISEFGDSKRNGQKGFDSLASKTHDSAGEELAEVPQY